MPLNTLRLNSQASAHPNDRIVFIKPLPRPATDHASYETADLLLRAIAAQCLPIMKAHYLSVTTLEEHEPNPEFIGRNFNNGEIIQLVLRSKNGSWLPVNMVQMVMMHELAHNVHMNHGKCFWASRNKFAEGMRGLWSRGYTGDGLWSTGRKVEDLGRAMRGHILPSEQLKDLPLCGGTFRSRGRKRKRKDDDLTWKEKRDRRIEKKFGKNGVALGEDDSKRLRLEVDTKGPMGVKPRVAQSKRGRDLRAAAALARFGSNKQEVDSLKVPEDEQESLEEDSYDYDEEDASKEDAQDINGQRLLDSNGNGMVRVCDGQLEDDMDVKQEMEELEGLNYVQEYHDKSTARNVADTAEANNSALRSSTKTNRRKKTPTSLHDIPKHSPSSTMPSEDSPNPTPEQITRPPALLTKQRSQSHHPNPDTQTSPLTAPTSQTISLSSRTCPICSMENPNPNPTCLACAHVLDPRKDPKHWKCQGSVCKDSQYINAGDFGICGICGERKIVH